MEITAINRIIAILPICFLISCASVLVQHKYEGTEDVEKESYLQNAETKGVVLVTASGSRDWGCGGYENAELRSIGFDFQPSSKAPDAAPDLVINSTTDGHLNYAFQLAPGTYGISYINIKVSRSMSDIGYTTATRSSLISDGVSKGGSFTVGEGEAVYIGHFALDCAYGPTLWRFYLEDQEGFDSYVQEFKSAYPFLNLESVKYQLFSTKEFGHDFELP